MVADRSREVADVSDGHACLLCEKVGKSLAEPRTDGVDEGVGAEGRPRVETDRLEPAIRNF